MRPNAAVRMGKGASDGLLQASGPSAAARTDLEKLHSYKKTLE